MSSSLESSQARKWVATISYSRPNKSVYPTEKVPVREYDVYLKVFIDGFGD